MKINKKLIITAGLIALDVNRIKVKKYKLETPKIKDSYKIVQISDFHDRKFNKILIHKIKKIQPDVIFITGDQINRKTIDLKSNLKFLQTIVKISKVFFVTGNHEARASFYPEFSEKLTEMGIIDINDHSEIFRELNIIGIHDQTFNLKSNSSEFINNHSKKDKFNILLAHQPDYFEDVYSKSKVDLVLSGHFHGGQFRIPFVGALYLPKYGFLPPYTNGPYFKNGSTMIVSKGLGKVLKSLRINNPPELVFIKLNSK